MTRPITIVLAFFLAWGAAVRAEAQSTVATQGCPPGQPCVVVVGPQTPQPQPQPVVQAYEPPPRRPVVERRGQRLRWALVAPGIGFILGGWVSNVVLASTGGVSTVGDGQPIGRQQLLRVVVVSLDRAFRRCDLLRCKQACRLHHVPPALRAFAGGRARLLHPRYRVAGGGRRNAVWTPRRPRWPHPLGAPLCQRDRRRGHGEGHRILRKWPRVSALPWGKGGKPCALRDRKGNEVFVKIHGGKE